jgi:hypothetical protein
VVFILSALAWTVLPHHKQDWQGLPNPDAVQASMRANPPAPGQYALPWARDPKALEDPAMKERMEKGPRAYITIVPNGMPSMSPMMVQSLIFNLVVSLLVAYVAWHALGRARTSPPSASLCDVDDVVHPRHGARLDLVRAAVADVPAAGAGWGCLRTVYRGSVWMAVAIETDVRCGM